MFHPFYVKNEDGTGQWKAASNLEAGDELLTEDGKKVFVSEVRVEKLEEEITVYNLELDEVHTYYVALGVLVHNMCATNKNKKENAGGSAGESGTPTQPYDVVNYGNKTEGLENHHGVLDVWAKNNICGYKSRANDSTTIVLTREQHAATKSVYREWLYEKTGRKVGGKVNWKNISPQDIQSLSEKMFDAAGVPDYTRRNYYNEFNKYIYGLGD